VADREDAPVRRVCISTKASTPATTAVRAIFSPPATRKALEQDESGETALHDTDLASGDQVRAVEVWDQAAPVVLKSDTEFLTVFDGSRVVRAARCQPDPAPTTARSRRADMRAAFWTLLMFPAVGLGYPMLIGALHRRGGYRGTTAWS